MSFNIRSFGSWIASDNAPSDMTEYGCFNIRSFGSWIASAQASCCPRLITCFNIRSFGSWIASWLVRLACSASLSSFNIRSFGSWIASLAGVGVLYRIFKFQYPLFRIVDCFWLCCNFCCSYRLVSISALSDRGLLL